MHRFFSTWYREVNPEPSGDLLENRWAAIESMVAAATPAAVNGMVRLAFGMAVQDSNFLDTFVGTFQEHDKAFPATRNDVERAVLAGSALASLFGDEEHRLGLHAALATVGVGFRGKRPNDVTPWVLPLAEQRLRVASESLRLLRSTEPPTLPKYNLFPKSQLEEEKTSDNWKGAIDFLFEKVNATLNTINSSNTVLNEYLGAFRKSQSLYEEESDILWWLFSKESHDLGRGFAQTDSKCLAIVAGKELADLTKVLPGPLAVRSFLDAALMDSQKPQSQPVSVQAAVNKSDNDWRPVCVEGVDLGANYAVSMPLHIAISKSIESKNWGEAFQHELGLPPTISLYLSEIGLHMYRERLFVRSLQECC